MEGRGNMTVTINANRSNYIENGTLFTGKSENGKKQSIFAGNTTFADDPIARKREEAKQKAMKVISDAWDSDRAVDKSVEDRKKNYEEMLGKKQEAQSYLNEINEKKQALMEEYGITEETAFLDLPKEYQERVIELDKQAAAFQNTIKDADKAMKDDTADIKAIAIERLKSNPMAEAQKTAEAIEAAANEEIIGMAIQEAKEQMDEKLEEVEQAAEEKAEKEEVEEERLENIQEIRAMQEAMIEGTKEAAERAKARQRENAAPELPFHELVELVKTNSETDKAQKALDDIKYSMNLLEADLKGIKVDEEI